MNCTAAESMLAAHAWISIDLLTADTTNQILYTVDTASDLV